MSKCFLFSPLNFEYSEEPEANTLWQVKYKVHKTYTAALDILELLPEAIDEYASVSCVEGLSLDKWQTLFEELNLEIIYDFPFVKEYALYDNDQVAFTATIYAMDLSRFENELEVDMKIGEDFLSEMNYTFKGNVHPEKFYNKMIETIDLCDKSSSELLEYSIFLLLLEQLCHRCLQYEKNIEWKII